MPTGFELSPGLAKLAKDYSGQPVIQSDFTNFEFTTLSFDAILLIGSLVHLEHDKFPPVFLQICKALKKNGLVLLSMKEGIGKYTSQDGRIFSLWPSEQLCEVVSASNFDILDFMRVGSSLKANETWLTYILKKSGE
jgi:SAM-dependent methyltransferase